MNKYETGAAIDLEEKAIGEADDCYRVTGYAAVFNNVDRGRDLILPGAFAKSLRDDGLPALVYQHDMKEVVGIVATAEEDRKGLRVECELPKDDAFVRDRLYPQLKRRGIKSMSFGYRVPAGGSERRKSDNVRVLKEINLFEVSFVTIPMNPKANVTAVKGLIDFQNLSIDSKTSTWDAEAALKRLAERFGDDREAMRRAFLFAPDSGAWDTKMLIADVDENGRLVANRTAIYKAAASVANARGLPEEALEDIKAHLDRYYAALDLESPWTSLGRDEWKALNVGERKIRLQALGVSKPLSEILAQSSGQPEADRKSSVSETRSPEETALLNVAAALGSWAAARSAIKRT